MIRYLVALALLGAPALAQVPDDSDWANSAGDIVNVDVLPDSHSPTGYSATAVDASGYSNPVTCTVDGSGNGYSSGTMETPGGSYRITPSKVGSRVTQKAGGGRLRYLKNVKNPRQRGAKNAKGGSRFVVAPPSGPVSTWPLSSPGDDVTSLPDPSVFAPVEGRR